MKTILRFNMTSSIGAITSSREIQRMVCLDLRLPVRQLVVKNKIIENYISFYLQIEVVITQVANSQPTITASGFCVVNLFILPSV